MDHDTLWWIFSATKVITCTAAMRLVEEGRLKLTDKVSDYLPAFGSLTVRQKDGTIVPATEPMRIVHLFTMTGGMDYDLNAPEITNAIAAGHTDTVSLCSAMASRPLWFEPGTHYQYSLCHDVLAAVVEVITEMKFSDYLRELMFEPLGMADTASAPRRNSSPALRRRLSTTTRTALSSRLPSETGATRSRLTTTAAERDCSPRWTTTSRLSQRLPATAHPQTATRSIAPRDHRRDGGQPPLPCGVEGLCEP